MKEGKWLWAFVTIVLGMVVIYSLFLNKPTYKITFDSNGGAEVKSQDILKGDKVTKPEDPVREGYVFREWAYQGVSFDFNTTVTSNMTIVAMWEEKPNTTTKKTTTKKTTKKKTTTKKTTKKKTTTKKKSN